MDRIDKQIQAQRADREAGSIPLNADEIQLQTSRNYGEPCRNLAYCYDVTNTTQPSPPLTAASIPPLPPQPPPPALPPRPRSQPAPFDPFHLNFPLSFTNPSQAPLAIYPPHPLRNQCDRLYPTPHKPRTQRRPTDLNPSPRPRRPQHNNRQRSPPNRANPHRHTQSPLFPAQDLPPLHTLLPHLALRANNQRSPPRPRRLNRRIHPPRPRHPGRKFPLHKSLRRGAIHRPLRPLIAASPNDPLHHQHLHRIHARRV